MVWNHCAVVPQHEFEQRKKKIEALKAYANHNETYTKYSSQHQFYENHSETTRKKKFLVNRQTIKKKFINLSNKYISNEQSHTETNLPAEASLTKQYSYNVTSSKKTFVGAIWGG